MPIQLDNTNTGSVTLKGPASSTSTLSWPSTNGASSQALVTDGSGTLSWASVSSPAKASGALIVNTQTVSEDYTLPTGSNAFSVGPITVSSGYAVTVSSGQRWVVI